MRITKAITEFLDDLKRAGKSPNTITVYQHHLDRLARLAPVDRVDAFTPELVRRGYDLWADEGKARASLVGRQTAFRSFAKWGMARTRRYWTDNPMDAVPFMRRPDHLPRPLAPDEYARIAALELPPNEELTRLLLVCTGLRVSEICAIRISDVNLESGRLRVVTKGGRWRTVELAPTLVDALAAYLPTRSGARAHETVLSYRNGRPMNRRSIEKWARQWGAEAGVEKCTPHRFRHLFGTTLLEQTGDLGLVQKAMGHRSIQSTTIYTRVADARVREAISAMPWAQRKAATETP